MSDTFGSTYNFEDNKLETRLKKVSNHESEAQEVSTKLFLETLVACTIE